MALLIMEGFDAGDVGPAWDVNPATAAAPAARTGSYSGGFNSTTRSLTIPASSTVIVGFAVYYSSTNTAAGVFWPSFQGDGGATSHMRLGHSTSTGVLSARRSTTEVANSGARVLPTNEWHYIEVKTTVADTGGIFVVRVDGEEWINYTGDTKNAGTATTIDRIQWSGPSGTWRIDDVYVCDGIGATSNDFLGDVKVETLLPNGNGVTSQWVGSDGNSVDNYALVDEVPANTTDYVASPTIGNRDLYEFGNLQMTSGQVIGVQPTYYGQKSDAGAASIIDVARLADGTVDTGPSKALSTTWSQAAGKVREAKPGGGAWTISDVNGAQFGVEVA